MDYKFFMWKCIEIGGEFMRGVEVEVEAERRREEKVEGRGWWREGSVRMEGPESGVSERFKR